MSAAALESAVRSLTGRRIDAVVYYNLPAPDPSTPADGLWDFDDWHDVVMGVQLTAADGTVFSASWDDSFAAYGVDLVAAPMSHYLLNVGEAGGPTAWEVTGHPRWQALLADPVTDAEVVWDEDPARGVPAVPLAIRLAFPGGEAWLIAGCSAVWPHDGRFHLGTDDLIVGFTRAFAARLGLLRPADSRGARR